MFIMGRTRRGFTPEYKDEAVKLVINTGRTVATVARELGLKEQTLGRWVHDFRAQGSGHGVIFRVGSGVVFDLVAQDEVGAGVTSLGGGEVLAQLRDGGGGATGG